MHVDFKTLSPHQLHRIYDKHPKDQEAIKSAWKKRSGMPYPYQVRVNGTIENDRKKILYASEDPKNSIMEHAADVRERRKP